MWISKSVLFHRVPAKLMPALPPKTRYNLLAFEIPLQGVFEVYRQAGRGLSIAAGVSSMVYLNESSVAEGFRYGGEVLAGTEGSVWTNASVESYETRSTTGGFSTGGCRPAAERVGHVRVFVPDEMPLPLSFSRNIRWATLPAAISVSA